MARASQHRTNLARTAMRLFRRQGFASTGLIEILAKSGAPKGSLYHHFPGGKDELAVAAVDMAGERMAETLQALAAEAGADAAAFVRGYCRVMAGWMAESDFRSGCPIATTMLEAVPRSEPIRAAGAAAFDRWIAVAAGVFAAAGFDRAAAAAHAEALIAMIEGALILARVRRSTAPIDSVADAFTARLGAAG
jgi:TetR/AcrR family transcriptional repressor of lmrAB and yxaGH operons